MFWLRLEEGFGCGCYCGCYREGLGSVVRGSGVVLEAWDEMILRV